MKDKIGSKIFTIFSKIPGIAFSTVFTVKSGYKWLEEKRKDDKTEGLWRIHDKLYDFTGFVDRHPGGAEWLSLTHGTDITELFETHHLSSFPSNMLSKYYIKTADSPRTCLLTFQKDGFFKTLQRRVILEIPKLDRRAEAKSKLLIDALVLVSILTAMFASRTSNYYLATISAIFLGYSTSAAHNFLHLKDNFRMYYFNLSMLNYREWRIMHCFSHHIFPNTYNDLGVLISVPFLNYLPRDKNFVERFVCWIYAPLVFALHFLMAFVYRLSDALITKQKVFQTDDLVSFIIPAAMFLSGGKNLNVIPMWIFIITISCFWFITLAQTAGHHIPESTHQGDEIQSLDFGVFQISTIIEKQGVQECHLLGMTHFGNHFLHHLFPSLDHSYLPQLNEIFKETCAEFELEFRECPWYEQLKGHFKQLARTEVNLIKKY